MKEIQLTRGMVAKIDDEDFERVSKIKWRAMKPAPRSQGGYAIGCTPRQCYKRKTIYMHRLIMGFPIGFEVDHINGDRLDNRRSNLRICTSMNNSWNMKPKSGSKTRFKGIKQSGKRWEARISVNSKTFSGGYFSTPEMAAKAYNELAAFHYGEFARLNPV